MSISWNDMCDDSDISAASSDEEIQSIINTRSTLKPTRFTQKNVSLPQDEGKRDSRQKKIDEKFVKVQKHQGQFLLLFIPKLKSCHPKEITQALKKNKDFQNVDDFSHGWNIKIEKNKAIKYVSEPYVIKGININVEYSKNNEKNIQKPLGEFKNRYKSKDEKKSAKTKNYGSFEEIVSPKLKQKATYTQKNSYPKEKQVEFEGNTQKKKSKYVLKESLGSEISKKSSFVQEKRHEQKKELQDQQSIFENEAQSNTSESKQREASQAQKQRIQKEETTSQKSDSIELQTQIADPNEPKEKDDSQTENDDQRVAEGSLNEAAMSNKESSNSSSDEQEEIEEEQKRDTADNKIEEASEEEVSSQEQVKVEAKKKKKKKKKNNGFIDPNNRFSGFG